MPSSETTIMELGNVNGVKLTLKVHKRQNSPNWRQFTISYKNTEKSTIWPKISLFIAIIFNFVALIYVRIHLTALIVIIVVFLSLAIFWVTHSVQSETLLVIPTVGIQNSVKYVCGKEDNFIPWACIDDVIINEVIKMNRVLYYLTVLVKQNDSESVKLISLFKFTKPRLLMLERIYSELQSILVDAKKDAAMGSGDKK